MILGGLDIATTTGAAVMRDGEITTETIKLPPTKKRFLEVEKKGGFDPSDFGRQFNYFRGAIRVWLIENKVEYLAIEEPLRSDFNPRKKRVIDTDTEWAGQAIRYEEQGKTVNFNTFFKLYSLGGIVIEICHELNIPYVFVNQMTWRKAFLGHGRPSDAKKEAKKMCEQMKIKTTSLDSCEAAGVVFWLNTHLNPLGRAGTLFAQKPKPLTPAQEDAKAAAEALFRKDA